MKNKRRKNGRKLEQEMEENMKGKTDDKRVKKVKKKMEATKDSKISTIQANHMIKLE